MMFIESGQGGQSEEKAFRQMLAYNPAAIVQFNIDNVDSCSQMLMNAGIPMVEIGAINHETAGISIGVDYSAALKNWSHRWHRRAIKTLVYSARRQTTSCSGRY